MSNIQSTLSDYNGYDLSESINRVVDGGFIISVNGERVVGKSNVAQNGTLYFNTPARTTRGTRTVSIKLGKKLSIEF